MARLGLLGHLKELVRRPSLLFEAVRAGLAMRRRHRPVPSSAYLEWRLQTAYGSANATPPTTDLVHYLQWRMDMRRLSGWSGPR